jgi:hypothetical protein
VEGERRAFPKVSVAYEIKDGNLTMNIPDLALFWNDSHYYVTLNTNEEVISELY